MDEERTVMNRLCGYRRLGLRLVAATGLWLLPILAGQPQETAGAPARILIVESASTGPYRAFTRSFLSHLARQDPAGAASARIVTAEQYAAAAPGSQPQAALVIAVGTEALRVAAGRSDRARLLAVLVPKLTYQSLRTAIPAGRTVSAIYLDQPLTRYLALARIAVPGLKTLGVIFGPSSAEFAAPLAAAAKAERLELATARMRADRDNPLPALAAVLSRSGALLALPDPVVYNPYTLPPLLLTTYRYRVPMIGFSSALVTAGAVAAVYSRPEQIGRQAAEMVQTDSWPADGAYPRYFEVSFNAAVAHALDLNPPPAAEAAARLRRIPEGSR